MGFCLFPRQRVGRKMINIITFMILSATQFVVSGDTDMVDESYRVRRPITVEIIGYINESLANKFASDMEAAHETGQPIILIVIRSYGGSVYSLLSMIDVIKSAKVPVATVVVGKAMSAGAVLLSCGTEGMRYAAPHATIMVHEISNSVSGKAGNIKSDADETTRLNELMLGIMSLNIGKKRNYLNDIIHSLGHADWYLTAEEALKHGIVNHIGVPEFVVDITVRTRLK